MTSPGQSGPEWTQPPFKPEEPAPTVSGPVILPSGEPAQGPSRAVETWRLVIKLRWPIAIVLWLATGRFWFILIAIIGVPVAQMFLRDARRRQLQGGRTEELR